MTFPVQPEFESPRADPAQDSGPVLPERIGSAMAVPTASAQLQPVMAAPGWYVEPGKPGVLRYWNGVSWEEWRKPLVEAPSIDQGQKNATTAYLLLIFLGGLGIHRFYLGRTGSGVAMLVLWLAGFATSFIGVGFLLFAAVGIWSFVDLFLVPAMVREASLRSVRPTD